MRILILSHGAEAAVRPSAFLGHRFREYLAIVKSTTGNRFESKEIGHSIPLAGIPNLEKSLILAGFEVEVSPGLVENQQRRLQTVFERIEALAERGLNLYPFQLEACVYLADRNKAILADQVGLGKTIEALVALPEDAPVLVIARASNKGHWALKFAEWRPDYRTEILEGLGSFRWPQPGEALILNPELMVGEVVKGPSGRIKKVILPEGILPGTITVADEIHWATSNKAARTQRLRALNRDSLASGGRAWGLTATPMLNKPLELWCVLTTYKLHQEAFGGWPTFLVCWNAREGHFGLEWGRPTPDVPKRLQRVWLRRDRTCLEGMPKVMPPRIITVSKLDPESLKICNEVIANLQARDIDISDVSLSMLTQGRYAFEEISRARKALATAKIPAMLDLIEEYEAIEEPLVVFSAHRRPIETLAKRKGWAVILGGLDAAKRTKIEQAFGAGELRGVAGTIGAMGEGMNLQRAHEMLFVDEVFTPTKNLQAQGRIDRVDQVANALTYTFLVADHPLDQRLHEILSEKNELIDGSVKASATGGKP